MSYLSTAFYIMVIFMAVIYYILPKKFRWYVLLAGSLYFYYVISGSLKSCLVFFLQAVIGYAGGIVTEKKRSKGLTVFFVILSILPLIYVKAGTDLLQSHIWMATIGISYYTLQMIAYIADIYRGKTDAQRNPLKYLLFISFFPQIVQGPIPRYNDLSQRLYSGNEFSMRSIIRSTELIIWGFFLKYMIADRASVAVDQIFADYAVQPGVVILLGAVLYSIQLYADFLACVTISQGVAGIFGIDLTDNFRRPYFSSSIQEFWRRWHMSLSFWLRDYVYIPLGGSRKGRIRKYINLIFTFLVSGLWHGIGLNFVAWGLLHAFYQIIGGLTIKIRNRLWEFIRLKPTSVPVRIIRAAGTSFLAMTAWILFRADSLYTGVAMINTMFTKTDADQFKDLGLIIKMGAFMSPRDWYALIASIIILFTVSLIQSRTEIRSLLEKRPFFIHGAAVIAAFMIVLVFGNYGYGFDASDFIYGGF